MSLVTGYPKPLFTKPRSFIRYHAAFEAELTRISALKSSFFLVGDWCAILFLISLPVLAHHQLWAYVVAVPLICRYQKALAILGHDGVHGRLFRSGRLNEHVSQYLLGGPILMSFHIYRQRHLLHHRFTQTARDPDLEPNFPGKQARRILAVWLIQDLSGVTFVDTSWSLLKALRIEMTSGRTGRRESLHCLCSMILSQAVLLGYAAFLGEAHLYFLMWLLPLATLSQVFSRIRRLSEHTGLAPGRSAGDHTRNVINPIETFLLAPHRANYHIEHHLNPAIPFYNLPRFSRSHSHELKTVHSSYFHVLRSFLK